VVTVAVGWVLLIGGVIGAILPHLAGVAFLAVIGAFIALVYTVYLRYAIAVGIRVYEDRIEIGGIRGRDRRVRGGKQPRRKLRAAVYKMVLDIPSESIEGIYLITQRSEIKHLRRDLRRYRKSRLSTTIPMGVFDTTISFAKALVVISLDPSQVKTDPPEIGSGFGQWGRIRPVPSPTWLVPTQNPDALRAVLQQMRNAPRVYDRLPSRDIEFEVS
jgi:hypothetical protein